MFQIAGRGVSESEIVEMMEHRIVKIVSFSP